MKLIGFFVLTAFFSITTSCSDIPLAKDTILDSQINEVNIINNHPLLKKLGIEMVFVPAGSFMMGAQSSIDMENYNREKPIHKVTLNAFEMGKYEVTQRQWKAIMGSTPSKFKECGLDCPVEQVNLEEIQVFISKLSQRTGYDFRLPTEAEWEYACRSGGEKEKYCGGDNFDQLAWYRRDFKNRTTHPVGKKTPNGLGIYDMSGNVNEWVQDWYAPYPDESVHNPMGPESGTWRVIRGGSWSHHRIKNRSTYRFPTNVGYGIHFTGFRLAKSRSTPNR